MWNVMSHWFCKECTTLGYSLFSIHDGSTNVWGGVMDKVSGLRDISWREGWIIIFEEGEEVRRERKPMQIVEIARRRLEDIKTEEVEEVPLRMSMYFFSSGVVGGRFRNSARRVIWETPYSLKGLS